VGGDGVDSLDNKLFVTYIKLVNASRIVTVVAAAVVVVVSF